MKVVLEVIIKRHTDSKVSDDVFHTFFFRMFLISQIDFACIFLCVINPELFSRLEGKLSGLYPEVLVCWQN